MLNKTDLKYLLLENLKVYSENVLLIGGNNPYHIKFNNKNYYIFIRNITDSGKGRPNEDELRCQFAVTNDIEKNIDNNIIFLAYYQNYNVFTVWNSLKITEQLKFKIENDKTSPSSVYTRFSILNETQRNIISTYVDSKGENAISFRADFLGRYLENTNIIFNITGKELSRFKKQYILERYPRNKKFIDNIKKVYNHRCAFCGISLGLVEAAHIIPHSHELGSDDIFNGINLCSLHHKAYDSSLIYFDENYSIIINEKMIEYLEKVNKLNNLNKFINLSEERLILPDDSIHFPKTENIIIANEIRGITI